MHHDAFRQRHAGSLEERRPVDGVEANDILADHVNVGRPVTPEFLVAVVGLSVAHTRQIRSQRVVPNVKHLLGIARPGHAPLDPLATDGNVAQAALVEAEQLALCLVGFTKSGCSS